MDAKTAFLVSEIVCATDAMYYEARGEEHKYATAAVLEVVVNRVVDPDFPDTFCGVVHADGAFSFVPTLRATADAHNDADSMLVWKEFTYAATRAVTHVHQHSGTHRQYFTQRRRRDAGLVHTKCYATHYLNVELTKQQRRAQGLKHDLPLWARVYTKLRTVGNHTFFTHHEGCE